ncbi:MAG: hypothetical protein JWP92_1846 [Caulobacter sp.]|nr:hypothetical protein [Caulobacter sp.]
MTAVACLRVFVGETLQFADSETMAALVAKVAGSYLESTWLWPRRFGLVAPFSFALADPRATRLDVRELQALAAELKQKLFGTSGDGDIRLLTFEGDQTEVMRFAGAPLSELTAVLEGRDDGTIGGRVCRITPDGVESVVPPDGSVAGLPPIEELEPHGPPPARATYRGVYHSQREAFIGSVVVWREAGATTSTFGDAPSTSDAAVREHDIPAAQAAVRVLPATPHGVLFLPISFSTIVKPRARAALLPELEALPRSLRGRVGAAVYDTPRAPLFTALSRARSFLTPFFSRIDLRVSDPAFQIENLPADLATSVTLVLPEANEATRLAAIARFMRERRAYRRKHVRQGVGDVRTRREFDACLRHGAPFLTGPAITDLLDSPVGAQACPTANLPLHNWSGLATEWIDL